MKMFNSYLFGGFFPHKGKTCAKIVQAGGRVHWVPVKKGQRVALAFPRNHSAGHLLVSSVKEKVEKTWVGLNKGELFASLGGQRMTLTKDWNYEVCDGPSSWWESLPPGTVILGCFNPGNSHVASTFWVLDKEITA